MQQFRLRSHDANLVVRDLDALGEGAQVIPPIAAPFHPQTAARRVGQRVDHVSGDRLVACIVERGLYPVGVGRGLIPDRLETGDTVLEANVIERGNA
ncbi:MAG: hypothetical protein U5M50_15580 [Sphingobium sp.]|nr:hypothetical protein [Sphingobium sp.]